ncbi:phage/plasmid primase, P4 family [Comamonas sp. C24C]
MNTNSVAEPKVRTYAVMRYASEKDNVGKQNAGTWVQISTMLANRTIRQQKSGKAFSPVRLKPGTSRTNDNVETISMAVADIDSEGVKDSATGQFLSVKKRAPTLHQLRQAIDCYTWAAHSSHSHDPQRLGGVIKYRVVFPLSRPCTREEWSTVWEGLNILLDGHCDRNCKDPSRLYYEPSCPRETAESAFFDSNDGELLDPDFLKELAQKPVPQHVAIFPCGNLEISKDSRRVPLETLDEVERVKSMLAAIPADCGRDQWRNIVWAVASTGWHCAESLAYEWSKSAPEKFTAEEFSKVWQSFKPDSGIGFGSLIHYAKQEGWADTSCGGAPGSSDSTGDIFNGREFARRYRDSLLFVYESNDVLMFQNRTGWVHAPAREAERAAKEVVDVLRAHAAELWKAAPEEIRTKSLVSHVKRSSAAPRIQAMIDMAKSEDGMTVRLAELDADPMLLGVENGILDLRTGRLLPSTPTLRVTKRCPVPFDPSAKAPQFEAFVHRIMGGKPALVKFLQRLTGYILTGEVNEQCFFFLYGLGRNGKTTFAELLRWLMGDYAENLPTATLTVARRDPGAASPDLMLLKGRRLALASELEENGRFAEAAIKMMTGGDTMQARDPYGRFSSWTPTHKLMVVGNHRPVISGSDHGMWRRVKLIPFEETITDSECDERLPEKLRAEGAGVLNWALAGLREWQRHRLSPPPEVKAAGAAYQNEMDTLGQWMSDHVTQAAGVTTPTAELYRAYSIWARESGWKNPMTRQAFGRRLTERGIPLSKTGSGTKSACGIALNDEGKRAAAHFQ